MFNYNYFYFNVNMFNLEFFVLFLSSAVTS
jgi:hypothetical protein